MADHESGPLHVFVSPANVFGMWENSFTICIFVIDPIVYLDSGETRLLRPHK